MNVKIKDSVLKHFLYSCIMYNVYTDTDQFIRINRQTDRPFSFQFTWCMPFNILKKVFCFAMLIRLTIRSPVEKKTIFSLKNQYLMFSKSSSHLTPVFELISINVGQGVYRNVLLLSKWDMRKH